MPQTDLIPSAEAAQVLGLNVRTVNRWAESGKLPVAVKIPGRTGANLYRREDVERLADNLSPAKAAS